MTRAVIRTPFSGAKLLRILTNLSVMDMAEAGPLFAEKLGYWVGFADAIALHGVHGAGETPTSVDKARDKLPLVSGLHAKFALAQSQLENSIKESFAANADMFDDPATPYALIRKFHVARQRDMELGVRPLRNKAREQVARVSPILAKLAALDATFDGILVDREKKLLAAVPTLMERRFLHLRATHSQPQGWLENFSQELQTVMLAELELRLLPTAGLVAALNDQFEQHA